MPDASALAAFAAAALLLAVVPGPAVLYIVTQSVDRGARTGIVSALGVATGGLVHAAAAAIGLSSLLLSSATAFEAVRLAGAAYLVLIGLRRLATRSTAGPVADVPAAGGTQGVYRRGVVVNVLNPKTALFFLAFLPQFVDVGDGRVGLQLGLLGLVFVAIALVSDSAYAVAAGTASAWLRRTRAFSRLQRWVAGSVFVGLGLTAALEGRR